MVLFSIKFYKNSNLGIVVYNLYLIILEKLVKCNLRWPVIHYLSILIIQKSYIFTFFRDAG